VSRPAVSSGVNVARTRIAAYALGGFFVALAVVLIFRLSLGDTVFRAWGWRIPFLLSAFLLAMALYIRLKLREAPLFARLKEQGKSLTSLLRDSLGSGRNWGRIASALLGATAGKAKVWYT